MPPPRERSLASRSAAIDNNLYLAWRGRGDGFLNVLVSHDSGRTFVSKVVSRESSSDGPSLLALDGQLFIAWKGDGNDQLNVADVALVAWSGDGNDQLNVAPVATSGFSEPPYFNEGVITNFPIQPGDFVTVSVAYNGSTSGTIDVYNQRTNQHFRLVLPRPPGVLMSGGTVEWIMEAINNGYAGTPPNHIPQFTDVVFQTAFGCGPKAVANPNNADTITILNGATTMNTVKAGDDTLTISYVPLKTA